ncbi:MAG TPA: putative Ig domain-containing protein, partial [Kribbella sp.]|nr:putative Ig domain-containing protein [Kribbella sp.]
EVEDRYTHLAGEVTTGDGYVRMAPGSKIAYLNGATDRPKLGFLVRTNGDAVMHLHTARNGRTLKRDYPVIVPDTGGQWRYVTTDGPMDDILFIEVEGATVDLDHININAAAELTGPVFPASPDRVVGWLGAKAEVNLAATAATGTTYTAAGLPEGAALDPATGVLSWKPTRAGSWTVTVAADDGTSMAARRITLTAAGDRASALELAKGGYEPRTTYESATKDAYSNAVAAADSLLEKGTDTDYLAALGALVGAVDGLRPLSPKIDLDGSLDYPGLVASSTTGDRIVNLVDGDEQTGTVYPQAVNLSHTFDFGPDYRVSATKFGFQSNIFADRLANSAVFGSNDGVTWTRLTPGVTAFTQDYNTLEVAKDLQDDQFRYLKIQMIKQLPDVLYGIVRGVFEMTEFHIFGERHEIGNLVKSTSITSAQAIAGKIMTGDTVDVAVTAKKPLEQVTVTVQGVTAKATSADGINWRASAKLDNVAAGNIQVAVDYVDADGKTGPTAYGTTDGSKLYIAGDPAHFIDVAKVATVTASDKQWPGTGLGADKVGYLLFDRDPDTYGDLNSGPGAYYLLDFGAHATVQPEEVLFLPRASHPQRANGTVVQASNDGQTWTDLTTALTGAVANTWSDQRTSGETHYRYLRIYNATSWFGDLSEVELYGDLKNDA